MGSSKSNIENSCIEELSNINENDLDISNIDKLQIKAIKEINNKIKDMEERKVTEYFINDQLLFCVVTVWFNDITIS